MGSLKKVVYREVTACFVVIIAQNSTEETKLCLRATSMTAISEVLLHSLCRCGSKLLRQQIKRYSRNFPQAGGSL